ncbi:hypothetical protein VPH35_005105 [Triticum aestivum]
METSYIWRGALQWWDDWQLRVLVLGSLGLQWFLLLAAPMRKYALPRVLRTFIWLAYISSDPLAIYALATLFNIIATQRPATSVVLWAPILLIYLGGQEGMSGYEIEDNKLWGRHTVTLVSQVAVALYAFYKSWPRSNDPKLLVVAVLLFVVGIISFSQKPWALKAKARRLAAVSSGVQGPKKPSNWRERMNQFFSGASHCFTGTRKAQNMSLLAAAKDLVAQQKIGKVEDVLQPLVVGEMALPGWLRIIFAFHYTREHVVGGPNPLYLLYHRLMVPILHITALTLFAMSGKHPYKHTHRREDNIHRYVPHCRHGCPRAIHPPTPIPHHLMSKTKFTALCGTIPSYNLIDTALREGDKSIGWIYMPQLGQLYEKVTQTVIIDLVETQDQDLASYRIFNSSNWVLSQELRERKQCLGVSFDRSVLLIFASAAMTWPDRKTRWKLMYRAWLGMLCYSASMCRGYLHAKSLGEGGEFLTYVWLVLMLKGAKSLVDKLQMPPETQASDNAGSQA